MTSYVTIFIGFGEAVIAIDTAERLTDEALDASIDDLLTFVDMAQAKRYTANANPERPPGSPYVRTFDLQQSTEKIHNARLQGEWRANIAYAEYVLGMASQQAEIHRSRWKSQEIVEQETIDAAPQIIREQVERRLL